MGNYTSKSREEWSKESLEEIKHKFGSSKISDSNGNEIEWDKIESYLGYIYDYKYKDLNKKTFEEISKLSNYDIAELEYYF